MPSLPRATEKQDRPLTAEWIASDADLPDDAMIALGGMLSAPTWDEYRRIGPVSPEIADVIRAEVERGGHDLYGEDMEHGYWRLSDGRVVAFSWRGWGDFRQAMAGRREGYMTYYWRS